MKRFLSLLGLIVLVEAIGISESHAAQRAHRPWLMLGSRHSDSRPAEISPSPAPTVSVSKAPEAAEEKAEAPTPKTGQKIAKRALKYKGSRYKFGGTSKHGMDCSGLVARVYEDLKMKQIPRASNALYNTGKPVRLSELRPGDLVFFKNTYRHGISHVGVYAGHNKFVHAANRRHGVIVTALSDPYYQLHYAGARRIY